MKQENMEKNLVNEEVNEVVENKEEQAEKITQKDINKAFFRLWVDVEVAAHMKECKVFHFVIQ